ncbi:three-Cys-motif partner protein TcmP [Candidatus Woesearchaeota archaeon]|nr:three-Cys-motif partner protein TcmP [Candidatus Woesearchaeota archaeon]
MKETKLPFKTWKYQEHTKIKHLVFADYFDKWIKIVGKSSPLNYFDGFGGIGAYEYKESIFYGSPILAAEIIKKNSEGLKRDACLIIIDSKQSNLDNIKTILELRKLDVEVKFINSDFDKAINKILDKHTNLAPSFFFVDPFGFKIKLTTLKKMMKIPKSEIFLNFMYDGIIRNLNVEQASNVLTDLFGSDEWKSLNKFSGQDKENKTIELYRLKLKEFCEFVYPFKISFPLMKRTYYYLFHLTNYYLGCEIMKSSFAKYNHGRVEYRGRNQNQMTFFDYDDIKFKELKKYLLSEYSKKTKTFQEIICDQLDETVYLVKHFRQVIKELEIEGKAKIDRFEKETKTGKPRTGLNEEDSVIFS